MVNSIKPIETYYKGYRFRSRLEAKWAVFFDTAGIKYQYEPEGYTLENGEAYLPDFYLPDLDVHVEVKGMREGYEQEILRLQKFIVWGGPIKQIVIFTDIPGKTPDGGIWHFPMYYWHGDGVEAGWFFFYDNGEKCHGNLSKADYPRPHIFSWWKERGDFSIEPISDYTVQKRDFYYVSSWDLNSVTAESLLKAKQARFEHGEKG